MTRADALRNRARVVDAAEAVFTEQGPDAGVDEVAARAGVGKATVYRSFPTKDHLLAAVACGHYDAWVARLREAAAREDPYSALRDVLRDAAEAKAARMLGGLVGAPVEVPELEAARAGWLAGVQEVIDAGVREGTVRADVTADELLVLFGGACRVLTARREADPAVWRRHAELAVASLRP